MIKKIHLDRDQIAMIKAHIGIAQKLEPKFEWANHRNEWDIEETDEVISGHTWMDNFDMERFLIEVVKVDHKNITLLRD